MKKAIIIGGHFQNKGAQAMVLATASEIHKKYPNCEILMFSYFKEEITVQPIRIINWGIRKIFNILFESIKVLTGKRLTPEERIIREHIRTTDIIFDVSGFALSSQFNDFFSSLNYLFTILLAKKFKKKMILLPQSFGPFDYIWWQRIILFPLMKYSLKYPEKIYARETTGYEHLKKFTQKNLTRSLDLVLLTDKPVLQPERNKVIIETAKNVAIIPNDRIIKWGNKSVILKMYQSIINKLIEENFNVIILRHSFEDLDICKEIYENYENNPKVKLYGADYDCITLFEIIEQMSFVIASRYHSLVHSLKANVPAIVVGWADKYYELMAYFNLEDYVYDVRNGLEIDLILGSLNKILKTYQQIGKNIKSINDEKINKINLFDEILKN
ncbi:MAG TPA: polysaccharide pyruvyl transferase family protein [Bacillota bacterium]|nr:polysaccharide pyruvyl transferase family protein [Bacillota bacterium]